MRLPPAGLSLLVVGYPTAVAAATRLRQAFRNRRPAAFVAFEAATAAVVLGWALRQRWAPAAVNAAALAAVAGLWRATGRRPRR